MNASSFGQTSDDNPTPRKGMHRHRRPLHTKGRPQPKPTAEKITVDRNSVEKATVEKATVDRIAVDRIAVEKNPVEKNPVEKDSEKPTAANPSAAKKPQANRPLGTPPAIVSPSAEPALSVTTSPPQHLSARSSNSEALSLPDSRPNSEPASPRLVNPSSARRSLPRAEVAVPKRSVSEGEIEGHCPLDNCPSLSWKHGRMTVEGYSRAAVQSYWRIPELKIGFDLGAQPWAYMGIPNYFISHTHLDHIAALPSYVARRRMMKMDPPTIYVPGYGVAAIHAMLAAFSRLDRGRMNYRLMGVEAGEEIQITRDLVVTTHATKHSIPSLGYIVWEKRRKLRPEFHHLSGDEIRDLRLAGTEVTSEIRTPLVAYAGDTTAEGLDAHPAFYQAEILITELTFLAPNHRKELIRKHGHTHLDDIVARRDLFQNQLVICGHFSTRYQESQIRKWVSRAIPDMLDGRLVLWL